MKKGLLNKRLLKEICHGLPDFDLAKQLLAKGADINVIVDGESLLSKMLFFKLDAMNLADIVKFLLLHGADPNRDVNEGFNCLYDACLINAPHVVCILLEAGADYNCLCRDTGGALWDWPLGKQFFLTTVVLPEHEKHEKNHNEIVDLLKAYNAKSSVDLI